MKHTKKVLLLFFIIIAITIIDLIRFSTYKIYPLKPEIEIITQQDEVYAQLQSEQEFNEWEKLEGTLQFIKNEYDVSDFKLVNLIRILYEYANEIPTETRQKIDSTLLNFRYWMDEPGGNSMCYWSENHQILFSSAEYLIGNFYKDKIFFNDKLTGIEHREKARKRILAWLEMRWLYGFTEFYSCTYYIEDVAALINLIDHADDDEIVQKSKIILDLLFYDIATQSFQGMMVSVSGRAYENNRKGGKNEDLGGITRFLLDEKDMPVGMNYTLSRTKNYSIPPVLKAIAIDTNAIVIKQSNGLDIQELKNESLFGTDDKCTMMQWGMEAFTNPEIVVNSLKYIRKNNMFTNYFLKDMRFLDFSLMNVFSLQPFLSEKINPPSNGKAIQRGNTYTYRTADYSLYTVQNYHPGDYADQHHVAGMNIGNHFSIFHTQPARKNGDKTHSPNYWVGYGRLPHVAQDENVSLSIYNLPEDKNVMEDYLLDYTHAYFPKESFDSVFISKNYVFGKKGNVYSALIGSSDFEFITNEDIVQNGRKSVWIIEAGSKSTDRDFQQFINRVISNKFSFDENSLKLVYESRDKQHELTYGDTFKINQKEVITEYPRFDSPYTQAARKPDSILIEFQGKILFLDFYAQKRKME